MKRHFCQAAIASFGWVSAIAIASPALAATFTYSDSTFNEEDWELTTFTRGLGGSIFTQQFPDYGNDGEFMHVVNTVYPTPGVQDSWVIGVHRKTDAIYNPKTQGAIQSIDFSEDSILFGGWYLGQSSGIALWQDDRFYLAGGVGPQVESWTQKQQTNLQQHDFFRYTDNPQNFLDFSINGQPDFSENGSPIQFGFFRSNSVCQTCNAVAVHAGIDNWKVTVHTEDPPASTPEPSTLVGILLLGFAATNCKRDRS